MCALLLSLETEQGDGDEVGKDEFCKMCALLLSLETEQWDGDEVGKDLSFKWVIGRG